MPKQARVNSCLNHGLINDPVNLILSWTGWERDTKGKWLSQVTQEEVAAFHQSSLDKEHFSRGGGLLGWSRVYTYLSIVNDTAGTRNAPKAPRLRNV